MAGMIYAGVAPVATAGGAVPMLEFVMTSLALSGTVTLTVSQDGGTLRIEAASATFSGNVVLYTSTISGTVSGTRVAFTTANPPSSLPSDLQLAGLVTGQAYLTAELAQVSGLHTTSG